MPPSVAPPLVQALFDEVGWATQDEPDAAGRDAFKVEQYVVISRAYTDPLGDDNGGGAGTSAAGEASGSVVARMAGRWCDSVAASVCLWCFGCLFVSVCLGGV